MKYLVLVRNLIKTGFSSIRQFIKQIPDKLKGVSLSILDILMSIVLLFLTALTRTFIVFYKLPLSNKQRLVIMKIENRLASIMRIFNVVEVESISRLQLFYLAYKSMHFKKSRAIVTVGGMALGVGAIVFLVSIGYGLQELIIHRVARLDELKQVDVAIQTGSNVKLSDKALLDFKSVEGVEDIQPLIGVVAKVNYKGSVSDTPVYAVTKKYLQNSAIKTVEGTLFETDPLNLGNNPKPVFYNPNESTASASGSNSVLGAADTRPDYKVGDKYRDITFTIYPHFWIEVRNGPSKYAELLGYTKQVDTIQLGDEILGEKYNSFEGDKNITIEPDTKYGAWIKSPVFLWKEVSEEECHKIQGCENDKYVPLTENTPYQVSKPGFFTEEMLMVRESAVNKPSVLGASTSVPQQGVVLQASTNTPASSDDSALNIPADDAEWLNASLETSQSANDSKVMMARLAQNAKKKAVVNIAMLNILGITQKEAIGASFDVSFVITGDLLESAVEKLESENSSYTIVGVIPGENTPFFYVPFEDLRSLGVQNSSQVKLVTATQDTVAEVRKKIESMGFITNSVVDTVAQIDSLFGTVRFLLGILGAVALGVAALGMFNTLTVSLLERTREVGLMKAMGMSSTEVSRLFLTESMIMGVLGGLIGILLGFFTGKVLSLLISIIGIGKGVGFLDVTFIPLPFVILVFILSLVVGIVTGFYPSRRAQKISALDALRYE